METPERIQKAYNELLQTLKRQGVEWVNPVLGTTNNELTPVH